jgi:hypothetical protein
MRTGKDCKIVLRIVVNYLTLSVLKLFIIGCPFPFLGLQSLMELAQAFCASQIFKVCDRFVRAMSGLDSHVDAVNKEIKI